MTTICIHVEAETAGWTVSSELFAAPLMFFSGAKAEAQACRLAMAAARNGRDSEVVVRDRQGELVGVLSYLARDHQRVAGHRTWITVTRRAARVPPRSDDELQPFPGELTAFSAWPSSAAGRTEAERFTFPPG